MTKKIQLDFHLLPNLKSAPLFISLEPQLESAIMTLPETFSRADAALRFCWFVSQDEKQLHADEPRATRIREAFLRACLMEYRAMDEVLARDLTAIGNKLTPLKIHQHPNPLLHMMKELRNLEIHLTSSALRPATIRVCAKWLDKTFENDSTIWVIEPLTEAKFKQLNNAKYYDDTDIIAMIQWFNDAQHEWGVHHLAYLAIINYCQYLVSYYNLQPIIRA